MDRRNRIHRELYYTAENTRVAHTRFTWTRRRDRGEPGTRGFPSRGLIGGSEGWNFPVKTSAISNVRVRRRYMVPRMIRVVTHPLGLPQQKTAPRATPGHPIAWAMQISFSPRVSVLNATPYPILLSVRRVPPSFSFARSVCASLSAVGYPFRLYRFLPPPPYPPSPLLSLPTPAPASFASSAVFVPPTGPTPPPSQPFLRGVARLFLSLRLIRYIVARPWPHGGWVQVISETNDGRAKNQRTRRTIC